MDIMTDLDERRERPCGEAMPTFTLKASDISADLAVDFWVRVQTILRANMAAGLLPEHAVEQVRNYFALNRLGPQTDPKLASAQAIAEAMCAYHPRKLAD
jgi:hypothetical protein